MRKFRVGIKKINLTIFCALLTLAFSIYGLLQRGKAVDVNLQICVMTSLCVLIFELYCIYKISGVFFSPLIFFLVVFYLFQNGQLLLLALGVDFNTFYINSLKEHTLDVVVFSSISNMLAGLAGVIAVREKGSLKKKRSRVELLDENAVTESAFLGFIVTGLIAVPLVLYKFSFALAGGYSAVREMEAYIPSILTLIEYLFVPFSVLALVYEKNQFKVKIIKVLICGWFIVTAFCGDRTTGIVGLFIVIFLQYLKDDKKKRKRNAIFLILACMMLFVLIKIVWAFRVQANIVETLTNENVLISVISELGFSCFPLFTMMNIVPSSEPFLYGKGYFFSLIGGIIPVSLDFTGTISWINQQSRIFEYWQSKYYGQYNFGFGFSLNAEAYINFGWYGLCAIFIVCFCILKYISKYELTNSSKFEIYTVCILLFSWLTLPRRDTYYFWKAIAYCIWFVKLYLIVLCRNRKRRSNK